MAKTVELCVLTPDKSGYVTLRVRGIANDSGQEACHDIRKEVERIMEGIERAAYRRGYNEGKAAGLEWRPLSERYPSVVRLPKTHSHWWKRNG